MTKQECCKCVVGLGHQIVGLVKKSSQSRGVLSLRRRTGRQQKRTRGGLRGMIAALSLLLPLTYSTSLLSRSATCASSANAQASQRCSGAHLSAARAAIAVPSREEAGTAASFVQLPTLNADEEARVRRGETLKWQQAPGAGGEGSGFAVLELCADPDEVWRAVSGFDRYPELIPTVRTATPYDDPDAGTEPDNVSRYNFIVSRIRLRLDVRFATDAAQRYACWRLDKPSWVLSDSTGYWHVEQCDDRPGVVRVWFAVSVRLTARVPSFVISLVSRLGLAKATRWLRAAFGAPDGCEIIEDVC